MRAMKQVTGWVMVVALAALAQPVHGQSVDVAAVFASEAESIDQEDPGARTYQRARESLNRRRYTEAAALFEALRDEHPRSAYVAESFYWEAFSRSREGGAAQLRTALELLAIQRTEYAEARTRRDADALRVRIEAQLARRGDADAAAVIAEAAAGPCDEDQEVRLAALSALMNMNAEQAVPILQEVLQSRDDCSVELRRRAVFLISQKMTDESVDILLDLAHRNPDPDQEVREQAVFWLHQVDSPEALDALASILMDSDDSEIQERAIFAISQRSGDERAIRILKDYAERDGIDTELRANAIFWSSQNPGAGGAEPGRPDLPLPIRRTRPRRGMERTRGPERWVGACRWPVERDARSFTPAPEAPATRGRRGSLRRAQRSPMLVTGRGPFERPELSCRALARSRSASAHAAAACSFAAAMPR